MGSRPGGRIGATLGGRAVGLLCVRLAGNAESLG